MAKVLWGVDPLAASRLGQKQNEPPFTQKELARIGIPAHKIDRVQAELARLAADKTLTRVGQEDCGGVVIIVPHRPPGEGGSREAGGGHNSGFFSSNCLVPCPLLWYNGHIVSENVRRGGKKSLCVAASHAEGVYV